MMKLRWTRERQRNHRPESVEPILQACKVCRVAMTGTDGWPYVSSDELWLHMG